MSKIRKSQIVDYLYGKMSKIEKEKFKDEIKNSVELRNEIEQLKNIVPV